MFRKILSVTVAAATAILDYDLLQNVVGKKDSRTRRLIGIAFCGSAAAADCAIELLVDSVSVGYLHNVATGWPTRDHLFPVNITIPGNSDFTVRVADAAATNPVNLILLFA